MNEEFRKYREMAEAYIPTIPPVDPKAYSGRGIIMLAGGLRYFPGAYINIRLLRYLGVTLPIEVWYLNEKEMTLHIRSIMESLGVTLINAEDYYKDKPATIRGGWELKTYSIINSKFREILFLDSDSYAVKNPEFLFSTPEFREHGAIFWPDFECLRDDAAILEIAGIPWEKECREWETGQIVIDKVKNWRPLHLAMHYNEHSHFYFRHVFGDKATFQTAYQKLNHPHFLIKKRVVDLHRKVMLQHSTDGTLLFQHRNRAKYIITGINNYIPDFVNEDLCVKFLNELSNIYYNAELADTWVYDINNNDKRDMELIHGGKIGKGANDLERSWCVVNGILHISGEYEPGTMAFLRVSPDRWEGRWRANEGHPVTLTRVK